MKVDYTTIGGNDYRHNTDGPTTAVADSIFRPEIFKPMIATEVSRYIKASTRTLEEWRRQTKESRINKLNDWALLVR